MLHICYLQLQVVATKTDVGVQKATSTVTITVNRNLATPIFQPNNFYSKTVEDTLDTGTEVIKISATDGDQVSMHCNSIQLSPFNRNTDKRMGMGYHVKRFTESLLKIRVLIKFSLHLMRTVT